MHLTHVKYTGKRINSDTINWYERSLDDLISGYFNTGDICVYESTLRLIQAGTADYYLNIEEPVDRAVVERLRNAKSTILLRGSNYLHEEMDWGYFDDWLAALDLPVVVCGVGAQAEIERPIILSPQGRRVWQVIGDHCHSIGVRGAFSAETLHRNGVHNVEVVGCPSIFRARDRDLKLRHAPGGPKRLPFSVRREVDKNYARDPVEFVEIQKEIIARLDLVADLYLSCHGEPEEKAFYFRAPRLKDEAVAKLTAEGWFDHISGGTLKRLYESKLYYFARPSDYDFYAPQFDAAVGYRVHAILPALAVGVPSVLFDYDTRSRELAETFDLPLYAPEEFMKMRLSEAFDPSRFDLFSQRFPERYDRTKQFFEKNGVATRM
jgi:Polysaccharide pyruvyl transferase